MQWTFHGNFLLHELLLHFPLQLEILPPVLLLGGSVALKSVAGAGTGTGAEAGMGAGPGMGWVVARGALAVSPPGTTLGSADAGTGAADLH